MTDDTTKEAPAWEICGRPAVVDREVLRSFLDRARSELGLNEPHGDIRLRSTLSPGEQRWRVRIDLIGEERTVAFCQVDVIWTSKPATASTNVERREGRRGMGLDLWLMGIEVIRLVAVLCESPIIHSAYKWPVRGTTSDEWDKRFLKPLDELGYEAAAPHLDGTLSWTRTWAPRQPSGSS